MITSSTVRRRGKGSDSGTTKTPEGHSQSQNDGTFALRGQTFQLS
jgi:hypothetical protein